MWVATTEVHTESKKVPRTTKNPNRETELWAKGWPEQTVGLARTKKKVEKPKMST